MTQSKSAPFANAPVFVLIVAILFAFAIAFFLNNWRSPDENSRVTNSTTETKVEIGNKIIYRGPIKTKLGSYQVDIIEMWNEKFGNHSLLVQMIPDDKSRYAAISGRDFDLDGAWETITYCEYRHDGSINCNSIFRTTPDSKWESWSENEDAIDELTEEKVAAAVVEMNLAIKELYNQKHLSAVVVRNEDSTKTVRLNRQPASTEE